MTTNDTVIPSAWWEDHTNDDPELRLLRLVLMAMADRDGIMGLDSSILCAQVTRGDRRRVCRLVQQLADRREILLYQNSGRTWAWVPSVPQHQPVVPVRDEAHDP